MIMKGDDAETMNKVVPKGRWEQMHRKKSKGKKVKHSKEDIIMEPLLGSC